MTRWSIRRRVQRIRASGQYEFSIIQLLERLCRVFVWPLLNIWKRIPRSYSRFSFWLTIKSLIKSIFWFGSWFTATLQTCARSSRLLHASMVGVLTGCVWLSTWKRKTELVLVLARRCRHTVSISYFMSSQTLATWKPHLRATWKTGVGP